MSIDIYAPSPFDKFDAEEADLYRQINQYRADNNLAPIPASYSLSLVANRHVLDLQENIGDLTHAWSDAPYKGDDSSTWPSMWEAPQRFGTDYTDNGFENAFYSSAGASADAALNAWQNSEGHNAVILNRNNWNDNNWKALGIGIYEDYAVMWVGESTDPDGAPKGVKKGFRSGNRRNNKINGKKTDDVLTGADGNDKIKGKAGDDIIGGGSGRDRINGQNGDDILFGQADNDVIKGGGGDDILYGGEGSDRLIGGQGQDTFVIELGNGSDIVPGFNPLEDKLGVTDAISLTFIEVGNDTIVRVGEIDVMTLQGATGITQAVVTEL
ncbi:MAG: CAP domain-containing protein [Leptolyngbyaceae cyanobacterium]